MKDNHKTNLEILLSQWGKWQARMNDVGLGHKSASAFVTMRVDNSGRWEDPNVFMVDDDMRRVHTEIMRLHPDMVAVIRTHYVDAGPVKTKIDAMRIARTVYYRHYEFAHKQLATALGGRYLRGYEANYFVPTHSASVETKIGLEVQAV